MAVTIRRRVLDESLTFEGLHPRLSAIYAARGIKTQSQLDSRLVALQHPDNLRGLQAAVDLLVEALRQQSKILIVGDFDADGATSTALSVLALRSMGADGVDYLVPNRFEYGYGLTPEIVAVAKSRSPDLIMTVDNGIASIDGVAAAKAAGIKVLVTDHHLPAEQTPDADAIVNPNQRGCDFPSKNLAGVGVVFYLMSALRARLRDLNWFTEQSIPEPQMASFLDIVALGTVADVVPLDHNNRILVKQGLERIRAGLCRPGIQALLQISGRKAERLVASDLGFTVGPRLNAAGRLDDMSLGIECLLADEVYEAQNMAARLDELNRERRAIETSMKKEALDHLEQLLERDEASMPWGICLYEESWHQGVIGILASRIKERYHRPVIAFADGDEGQIKGSARSVPGLHIRDALDAVASRHPGLLSKFGGHAMAAGMTIEKDRFEDFREAFDQQVRLAVDEQDLQAVILSDGELAPSEFSFDLAETLRNAGPWGQQFPEPLFDGDFLLVQQRIVGEKHLKMVVAPVAAPQFTLDAIAFNVDLDIWPSPATQAKLAYKLDINEFRGKVSLQLMVDYLEPVS